KALFDEDAVIPNPVQPDPKDPTKLIPYQGEPLTVGGELNKLAWNYGIGRDWAGIHWRSDFSASLALGEALAISVLRDERQTYREPFEKFTFTRFDGTRAEV
ncbi:MAG: twin-arginine translocation pathway signal protein, partial [Mesorhizobium sp.]